MLTLPQALIEQKNQLADSGAWIWLMKLVLPDGTTHRFADSLEDVSWNGYIWQKFAFDVDDIADTTKNEVPQLAVKISNVNRLIQSEVESVDGAVDSDVTLYILYLNSDGTPTSETNIPMFSFRVVGASLDAEWATFKLGAASPFTKRNPKNRIMKSYCRFIFKSEMCGYSGSATECNKTLTRCKELNNSNRFGGFPGVGRNV